MNSNNSSTITTSSTDTGSSSTNMKNDSNNDVVTTTTTTTTASNFSLSTIQDTMKQLPSIRKKFISDIVQSMNTILQNIEIYYKDKIQLPINTNIEMIQNKTIIGIDHLNTYILEPQRTIYGPYTIVGSSIVAGTVTYIRNRNNRYYYLSRIPKTILSSMIVGSLSYGIIYGLDSLSDDDDTYNKMNTSFQNAKNDISKRIQQLFNTSSSSK